MNKQLYGALFIWSLAWNAAADLRLLGTPSNTGALYWGAGQLLGPRCCHSRPQDLKKPGCERNASQACANPANKRGSIGPFNCWGGMNRKNMQAYAWEPSTFNYNGLGTVRQFCDAKMPGPGTSGCVMPPGSNDSVTKYIGGGELTGGGQKANNYDNFLRSNIDNEQDNRDFYRGEGRDHLPFRTWNARQQYISLKPRGSSDASASTLAIMKPGHSKLMPLRWNNPHSAELEVNLWILDHAGKDPIVVPIRRPTCSGEGYQNNIIKFTIPNDFADIGAKIPGFRGCTKESVPMCTVQVYAHSIESRQYAYGFPIEIQDHNSALTTSSTDAIQKMAEDPWFDLTQLRELCRPSNDPDADIKVSVPRWARLPSDVYNHAYQNSDFSPYSGQQFEGISQNLQASAINKMVTGNRGELGRSNVPASMAARITQLQLLEDTIYKNYETLANKIIKAVGAQMKTTQDLENGGTWVLLADCFRCAETGSMKAARLTTNTYIPSFQLPTNLMATAKTHVPSKYSDLITETGQVRIYVQSLLDLMPFFAVSHPYGIIYQSAMIKNSLETKPDVTKFRTMNAAGERDNGVYSATAAKFEFASAAGCPQHCLYCKKTTAQSMAPLMKYGANQATCISDGCEKCADLYNGFRKERNFLPILTTLAKEIVQSGLPKGMDGVASYPDTDGSVRLGRPHDPTVDGTVMPPMVAFNMTMKSKATPPPPANPEAVKCHWVTHQGKEAVGYADGDTFKFGELKDQRKAVDGVTVAKTRCMELFMTGECKAVTCDKDMKLCTVRSSETLKASASGETTMVYECSGPTQFFPPANRTCAHGVMDRSINYGGSQVKKSYTSCQQRFKHDHVKYGGCRDRVGTMYGGFKVKYAVESGVGFDGRRCNGYFLACWLYADYFPQSTTSFPLHSRSSNFPGLGDSVRGYRAWERNGCRDGQPDGTYTTPPPTPAPTDAPTPAPTSAPTPAPTDAPTPAPTDAPTPAPSRRRRGSRRRRRRSTPNGDAPPGGERRRRRGSRRRRRRSAAGLAQLFQEVRMHHQVAQ